jgi:hypothetical protein
MAQIDIEDYLDEASTRSLVSELKTRKGYETLEPKPEEIENLQWLGKFNKLNRLEKIKQILGLREFATKKEIINEINEL